MDETPLLRVGDTLGRFEITGVVSGGGMGEVYRARDTQLQRDVAIKLLRRSEPHDLDRFKREAATGASFSHPHIMSVFDVGTHQQGDRAFPYLVMQFIEGQSLRKRMGGASKEQLVRWLSEVADGLDALHRRGVVHRDIKPENIMIGTDDRARIVDFGLAKTDGTTVTTEGTVVGTMDYLSPEQAAGHRLNYRSDIFSFGIVLCEALTGQHPFRAATVPETVRRIYHEPPLRIPDGELGKITTHCLKKEPKERYDDAADLARHLREQVTSAPSDVTPTEPPPSADATTVRMTPVGSTASTPVIRRRWVWIVVLVAVLLAAAMTLYKKTSREERRPTVNATPTAPKIPGLHQAALLPACGLTGSPGTISYGHTAQLRWSSTNAADVVISPNIGIVGPDGSIDVSPRVTTTYNIAATNVDGVVARGSVTIEVTNAPADFKTVPLAGSVLASPDTIRRGEHTFLKWNSFDATRVIITPTIGIVPLHGSISVAPRTTTTYTMTLSNDAGGLARGTAIVYVQDADATTLPNQQAGITCVAATQGGVGTSDSSSTSCSVQAYQRVTQATLSYTLDDGGEISINGRTVFATAPGAGPRDGTLPLPVALFAPGSSFLVKVTARNAMHADGTPVGEVFGKATVHLAVTEPMAGGLIMDVSPAVIKKGGTASLSWSSVEPTVVVINPVIGMVTPKGSMTVAPTETTTYTIKSISAGGDNVTGSVTLRVQ
jgi:serine/threonine protein kinase